MQINPEILQMKNWGLGRGIVFTGSHTWLSEPGLISRCLTHVHVLLPHPRVRNRCLQGPGRWGGGHCWVRWEEGVGYSVQFSLSSFYLVFTEPTTWVHKFMFFTKFGKSLTISFSNFFIPIFFSSPMTWMSDHLISFPQIPKALFIIFQTLSLCSSDWIISINLSVYRLFCHLHSAIKRIWWIFYFRYCTSQF